MGFWGGEVVEVVEEGFVIDDGVFLGFCEGFLDFGWNYVWRLNWVVRMMKLFGFGVYDEVEMLGMINWLWWIGFEIGWW